MVFRDFRKTGPLGAGWFVVVQWVEHSTSGTEVVGSNPSQASDFSVALSPVAKQQGFRTQCLVLFRLILSFYCDGSVIGKVYRANFSIKKTTVYNISQLFKMATSGEFEVKKSNSKISLFFQYKHLFEKIVEKNLIANIILFCLELFISQSGGSL